jgi:sec-independent protein translocase protein TatC
VRAPRRLSYGEEATLVEHLGELRSRLIVALIAIAVGTAAAYAEHGRLVVALEHALPADRRRLVTFGIAEPFLTSMWISVCAGLILASPFVLHQVWAFLAPALDEGAQRMLALLTGLAAALGSAGLAFGYFLVLPAAVRYLTNYDSSLYDIQVRARDYISFSSAVLIAVVAVFELPVVVLGLNRIGLLSADQLRRHRRIGYAAMAVLAVVLPGVDPVTTTLEMLPLFALFETAIWLSVLFERRAGRSRALLQTGADW